MQNPTSVKSGEGFWVKNSDQEYGVTMEGGEYDLDFTALSTGWSLVSSGIAESDIASQCPACKVFAYENGGWNTNPESIEAGKGFWVYK